MSGVGDNIFGQLNAIVERIERLEEEIAGLNADKSDVFKEAKGNGFDVAALREVVGLRRKQFKNPAKFAEKNEIVDLYLNQLEAFATGLVHARPAPARAQAVPTHDLPPHDKETGEITQDTPEGADEAPAANCTGNDRGIAAAVEGLTHNTGSFRTWTGSNHEGAPHEEPAETTSARSDEVRQNSVEPSGDEADLKRHSPGHLRSGVTAGETATRFSHPQKHTRPPVTSNFIRQAIVSQMGCEDAEVDEFHAWMEPGRSAEETRRLVMAERAAGLD